MPQIINPSPGIGALLGSGISTGLQQLAQNQLTQMNQRKSARGLEALGIPSQEAYTIAGLPDQIQGLVVKNYLSAAENQGLNDALSALKGESTPEPAQQFYQQAAPNQPAALSALQNFNPVQASTSQAPGKEAPKSPEIPTYMEPQNKLKQQQKFADLLKNPRLKPEHRLKLEALQQAKDFHKEKLSAKEQEIVAKETKPFYDEISKGSKAAQNNNKRLDRMEELVKKGNLVGSAWGSLFDTAFHGIFGFGVDLHSLLHPDSQEFRKLSNDFLKDAKDTFGSRLTNYDVKTFLSTVPTLSQTDAGKLRVIRNLRSFNEAALARKKAMDEIIKANGGKRPANLDTLVDERITPQLDEIARKFKEGMPEEESSERENKRSWLVPEPLIVK